MNKLKNFMIILVAMVCMFIIPNMVSAYEDTFKTTDGINVKKTTVGTDGTLEFAISNITLDEEKEYKWGIATSKSVDGVKSWYMLDGNSSSKTASFSLSYNDSNMQSILRSTNIAYLYVKENGSEGEYIIDGLKLDLELNPAEALKITHPYSWYYALYEIYDIHPAFYQFVNAEKGTDIPTSGWIGVDDIKDRFSDYSEVNTSNWIKEDGKYYLWCKYTQSGTKTFYAYKTITIDNNAPTVKKIEVVSPQSGTYKTSQTVKIKVVFSETITGTTVPTLKIKFGEGAERSVTNGTIKSNYIEYSYNIQESDKGQLATVSLSGGTIKDSAGIDAKLSCPIISGYAIKANTEGTTTNNTDNQDKTNNQQNNGGTTSNPSNNSGTTNKPSNNSGNSNGSSTTNKGTSTNNGSSSNSGSTTNKKDNTTAPGKIPQTGEGIAVAIAISIVALLAVFGYIKYNKYKEI